MKNLKFLFAGLVVISAAILFSCNSSSTPSNVSLKTDIDSVSYALGTDVGTWAKSNGMPDLNTDAIAVAFKDVFAENELLIPAEDAKTIIQNYFTKLRVVMDSIRLIEAEEFLEENAKKEGVIVTESGLQYEVIKQGDGPIPLETDMVEVVYRGTLIDGTEFDATKEGQTSKFRLNGVIKAWTEALSLMPVGSKWKLYVHPNIGYGNRQMGQLIKPNSALIFEVELLKIIDEEERKAAQPFKINK